MYCLTVLASTPEVQEDVPICRFESTYLAPRGVRYAPHDFAAADVQATQPFRHVDDQFSVDVENASAPFRMLVRVDQSAGISV